ncbi:MAG: MGMT family protein [Deltaproteobacteria bacterium]|nr:MGMT family protein [Deltaproteobacteria bacterium]
MAARKAPAPRRPVTGEQRVVGPGFNAKVYAKVREVPAGRVTTYGDVAGALGSRRVARQVGFALAALDLAAVPAVPWHRVINGQGRLSYRGDVGRGSEQELRLAAEGVHFDEQGRVIDFARLRHLFATPRPGR